MESLKDIGIKYVYSSEETEILKEFYIPVLSVAKNYYRITGYFSSNSLAVAAKGMGKLIENHGRMKLITGMFVKKGDILVAEEVIENPDKIIKEMEEVIKDFNNIEDVFVKESIRAFAWMLAKDLLEIKIAIPMKSYTDEFEAIFHPKIGIIEDNYGNKISFSGSINETGVGWLGNIEEFKVFRSWEDIEQEYFKSDEIKFSKLWNNLSDKVEVIPLHRAIKEKLIKLAPKDKSELNFSVLSGNVIPDNLKQKVVKKLDLRPYQERAIENYEKNNYSGILNMATGTGKTYIGLQAILNFFNLDKRGIVVVVSPTNEICNQWKEKIEDYIAPDKIILNKDSNWIKNTKNSLHDYVKNRLQKIVFITTYDSLDNLVRVILEYGLSKLLLISDEVHSFGAKEKRKILENHSFDNVCVYRLGLSATPARYYEKETEILKDFFRGVVFTYNIGDAIKDKVLCPYYYFVEVVEMTDDEFKKYLKLTRKLGRYSHIRTTDEENDPLSAIANQRANIAKSASNKFYAVEKVLKDLKEKREIGHTFIFCIDFNQLNRIKTILERLNISYSQITGREKSKDRSRILKSFASGDIEVILSMVVLNEGIDIPSARNAIMLSSSANLREYVQRRGRVLRQIEGESKVANIFDFMVVPPKPSSNRDLFEIERKIVKKELIRLFEFIKYSKNKVDIFKHRQIDQLISTYNLGEVYKILVD